MAGPGTPIPGLIDCHAHVGAFDYAKVQELAVEWQHVGVRKILAVGMDVESSRGAIDMSWSAPNLSACVGLHPWKVGEAFNGVEDLEPFRELTTDPQVLAVSEVGLDTRFVDTPLETQKRVLTWFVELAKERGIPLILHLQTAADELLDVWHSIDGRRPGAAIHSFMGTAEEARMLLDEGMYLSVGPMTLGIVGPHEVDEDMIRSIPDERLLLDSDAMTAVDGMPEIHPAIVADVAESLAAIRRVPVEPLVRTISENLIAFLRGRK